MRGLRNDGGGYLNRADGRPACAFLQFYYRCVRKTRCERSSGPRRHLASPPGRLNDALSVVAEVSLPTTALSATPSHDEYPLNDQRCSCGSSIMYRRRFVMGERDREMTFAAWCQKDPDHRLPGGDDQGDS